MNSIDDLLKQRTKLRNLIARAEYELDSLNDEVKSQEDYIEELSLELEELNKDILRLEEGEEEDV